MTEPFRMTNMVSSLKYSFPVPFYLIKFYSSIIM